MNNAENIYGRGEDRPIDIEGDFSDFDRVFFQRDERNSQDFLLLFSKEKQMFMRWDLAAGQMSDIDIPMERAYQQVEVYDKKVFCVDGENRILDVFFLSKKQQMFRKRTFRFTKKELKLKEDFGLTVWNHKEGGIIYRCLMGPLEDGRYMNFDLLERYFDYKINGEQTIDKVICINMAPDDRGAVSDNIVWALDERKKSFMCYDRDNEMFFEYNDFGGEDSKEIEVMFRNRIQKEKLRRMYFYYPYDFFSHKDQNKLKTMARNVDRNMEVDDFVRDKYKEVLLCSRAGVLQKITLLEDLLLKSNGAIWKAVTIDETGECEPVDITFNHYSGEIYCLCRHKIRVYKNSGRKPRIIPEVKAAENYKSYNS